MAERILLTGAAGFIGSHLARRLVHDGHEVAALVRPSSDLWRLEDVLGSLELVRRDLLEPGDAGTVDLVFHLAAAGVRPGQRTATVVEENVLGTLAALELAAGGGARKFVYCGSCFEYGPGERHREDALPRPTSEYGAAKSAGWLLADAWSRGRGLPVASLRPFTVYGPFEAEYRLVPSVALGVVRKQPVLLTGGEQLRDFVYVTDAVEAFVRAGFSSETGTFNVCSGMTTSVRELAERAVALSGVDVDLRFGILPDRPAELPTLSGDPSLAAAVLDWSASTPLDDGLALTLDWFHHRAGERRSAAR